MEHHCDSDANQPEERGGNQDGDHAKAEEQVLADDPAALRLRPMTTGNLDRSSPIGAMSAVSSATSEPGLSETLCDRHDLMVRS